MSELLEKRDLLRQIIQRARLTVDEFGVAWAALDQLADTAMVATSTASAWANAVHAPARDLEAEGHTFVPVSVACTRCGRTPLELLMRPPAHEQRWYPKGAIALAVESAENPEPECSCSDPVPDLLSSCGRPDCADRESLILHAPCGNLHAPAHNDQWCHKRVPTLCVACGGALKVAA